MLPRKRRAKAGRPIHKGRVTDHDDTGDLPSAPPRSAVGGVSGSTQRPKDVPAQTMTVGALAQTPPTANHAHSAASGRFSPPQRAIRLRPG